MDTSRLFDVEWTMTPVRNSIRLMDSTLRRESSRLVFLQFCRFILVGILNTGVGYLIYVMGIFLSLQPHTALLGSFAFAIFFNYLTYARLVFHGAGWRVLARFAAAYVVIYAINVGALEVIMKFGAHAILAQALALPLVVACTFAVLKLVVFRRPVLDQGH